MTLDDVAILSGEEMIRRYGRQTEQNLIDLLVIAVRKGEDDEATAIDRRLREVERLLHR